MWDGCHVGWSQSIVVVPQWSSGSLTPGARLLEPHVAAARVDEWFPLGGDEMSSRAKLFSIAAAVFIGADAKTETRVLRAWVACAFRERALVAYQLPAPVLTSHAANAAPRPAATKQEPIEDDVTWFSLKVLDEVGAPIGGLDVMYSVAGALRTVTTDGAGIARVDNVKSGFASASLAKLDQVRDKLRPRWDKPRDPKKFDDPGIVFRELGETVTDAISLENETEATLVITPYFKCHEIPGAHFAFGRSFVLGEAIDNLAAIAEDLSADNGRKAMIFGHTDLSGPEALNKELSERRARAVFALFTQDTKAWDELWNGTADGANWQEKWDLEEAQHMLNALHVTDDEGLPINEKGVRDAPTKQAIHRFRSADYPEKPDEQAPLPPSDFLGKDGLRELFLAYAKLITRKPIDAARFQKAGGASFMGCGELNPLSIAAKDQESRRAVVFVYDGPYDNTQEGQFLKDHPKVKLCHLLVNVPLKVNPAVVGTKVFDAPRAADLVAAGSMNSVYQALLDAGERWDQAPPAHGATGKKDYVIVPNAGMKDGTRAIHESRSSCSVTAIGVRAAARMLQRA